MGVQDDMINRAADKVGLSCKLIRLADPNVPGAVDIEATIKVTGIQYRERDRDSGEDFTQETRYWMIPAVRLAATGFPGAPKPGDRMIFSQTDFNEVQTIRNSGPGFGDGGTVVRYDVETTGVGV